MGTAVQPLQGLDGRGWLRIIGIGFAGNTLYYAAMSGAVATIGPAPVSLIFGALPIIMTVVGNLRRQVLPWLALLGPMLCIVAGVAVTTATTLGSGAADIPGGSPSDARPDGAATPLPPKANRITASWGPGPVRSKLNPQLSLEGSGTK